MHDTILLDVCTLTPPRRRNTVERETGVSNMMQTRTLTHLMRSGALAAILFLAIASLVASPQTGYAEPLGHDIVCHVFTTLTNLGDPIPVLNGGDCPDQPPPPPPPPPTAACSNDLDDDADSFIDENDPNCHTDGDPANTASYDPNRVESGTLPACWNNQDDDEDGKKDFPNDPGCASATDTNETDEGGEESTPQCSDGLDNDSDGNVDNADPACHTDFDASNGSSYDASRTDEAAAPPPTPQCSDGLDNDGDGKVDGDDPGCSLGASDNDETDPSGGVENASVPASSGGSSSSGGGGGGGGGGGSLAAGTTLYTSTSTGSGVATGLVLGTSTAFSTTTDSCDRYLTSFIREGKENDIDQVKRLQRFLRDFESAQITETGSYDTATLTAVHAFQAKYASDILKPWGISKSTGYVYLTTRKKVNEIFCRYTKTFFLTVEEQQKIDQARASLSASAMPAKPAQPRAPAVPQASEAPQISTATATTSKGQGVLDRTFRFFRDAFDRLR